MPSNIILHIGLPKTGAAFLQRALFENRDQLAASGISYPLPTASKSNAQHDFVRAFHRGDNNALNALFEEECRLQIEGSDRLLMSSEEFADWDAPRIQDWKTYLDKRFDRPGYRVHMCIRRWVDMVPALWQQHVIAGGLTSFPEYALGELLRVQREHRFAFEPIAERWIDVFGRSAIRIVPIERIIESGRDVTARTFQTLVGFEADEPSHEPKSNRTLAPEQLELIRAVSVFGHRRYGKSGDAVAPVLRRLLRRRDPSVTAVAERLQSLRCHVSLNDQQPPFPELEHAAIMKLGDVMDGVEAGRIFPPVDPSEVTYIRDVYWPDRGFAETIEQVYAHVTGQDAAPRPQGSLPGRTWLRLRRWLSKPAA